jgi:hypothetical protein
MPVKELTIVPAKISKSGNRYQIEIPQEHIAAAKELHGKMLKVTIKEIDLSKV